MLDFYERHFIFRSLISHNTILDLLTVALLFVYLHMDQRIAI